MRIDFPSSLGRLFLAVFLLAGLAANCLLAQAPPAFVVKLPKQVTDKPITGRVLVFVTTNKQKPPMRDLSWFGPEPFAAIEVKQLAPEAFVIIDDKADCFPEPISKWPDKTYRVQAILDHDIYYPEAADGPGNFYSEVVTWSPSTQPRIELVLDQVVPEFEYVDTDRLKFIQRKSDLLSKHFGRDIIDRAAVILPKSYDSQPDRRYPVYYEITGFGGNLRSMSGKGPGSRASARDNEQEFIHVMLTGECKYGHHVYADSLTNGPRGEVLVKEMIPHIDANFRTIAETEARFVGGHSSGGWSSLWLQVNYPNIFGAVFSTSPDPVDFRDFQGTDLYASPTQSVYIDAQGNRRPLARRGTAVILRYDDFCKMDQALGRGGQMRSFDAVFSPLDSTGEPKRCWHTATGQVDPEVAEYWKRYDISLILAENWEKLKEPLAGKIHIAMGDLDTFYLEGATFKLADRLKELGSDAQVEIVPGASHSLPPAVMQKMRKKMMEIYQKKYNSDGTKKT